MMKLMRANQFLFTFILIGALGFTSCKSQSNSASAKKRINITKLEMVRKNGLDINETSSESFSNR